MPNLTVAVLGPPDFARELGKRGTASDITLYNLKRGTDTVTFIDINSHWIGTRRLKDEQTK
jgi:selenocysteine-specific translation elongation factor